MNPHSCDYDYIVIGSGFGGSVAALRLAQKGYRVLVLEQGRRFNPEDFPKSNWNLAKYFWLPALGLRGIQAMTLLKDVFILHGTGVGGGSLVYANNLLTPPESVLTDPAWGSGNWTEILEPYYAEAKRMLGATPSPVTTPADDLLRECAARNGREQTFHVNDVGIYFGEPDVTVPDPYFNGEGPDRTGCTLCGGCMVGCRYGAKNTLDRNYLYLAEQLGVIIQAETRATAVQPNPQGGYTVKSKRVSRFSRKQESWTAKGVVFAAGVLGTVKLLNICQKKGFLPHISSCLGDKVRTNSEALVGTRANGFDTDYSQGIAITSGIYPDDHTHIETVRYGKGQDAMSMLATLMVDGGPPWPRPLRLLATICRHPLRFFSSLNPHGWAERTTILLVMQTISNYLRLEYRRRWWRMGGYSLNSNWHTDERVPSYIPLANRYAREMAEKVGGSAFSIVTEAVLDVSSTAHILGGCVMSKDPSKGVINHRGQIHGHPELYVMDGSVIPVNLGVNPSLTITALAEYIADGIPSVN